MIIMIAGSKIFVYIVCYSLTIKQWLSETQAYLVCKLVPTLETGSEQFKRRSRVDLLRGEKYMHDECERLAPTLWKISVYRFYLYTY